MRPVHYTWPELCYCVRRCSCATKQRMDFSGCYRLALGCIQPALCDQVVCSTTIRYRDKFPAAGDSGMPSMAKAIPEQFVQTSLCRSVVILLTITIRRRQSAPFRGHRKLLSLLHQTVAFYLISTTVQVSRPPGDEDPQQDPTPRNAGGVFANTHVHSTWYW